MNTENSTMAPDSVNRGYRPSLPIYHPNGRGTGCAVKMELHPAHDDIDGSIMVTFANQIAPDDAKSDAPGDGYRRFARFDWQNRITIKLDFSDLCRILQVFRGECHPKVQYIFCVQDLKQTLHSLQYEFSYSEPE